MRKLGNWYQVEGVLQAGEPLSGSPEFYLVDQDHRRQPIQSVKWNEDTQSFTLKIYDADFLPMTPNELETNLSMGKKVEDRSGGDLSIALLNVEVFFRNQTDNTNSSFQALQFAQAL